jgi:hypothetical protein
LFASEFSRLWFFEVSLKIPSLSPLPLSRFFVGLSIHIECISLTRLSLCLWLNSTRSLPWPFWVGQWVRGVLVGPSAKSGLSRNWADFTTAVTW